MTVEEAAKLIGVTPQHVRDLARSGKIPGAIKQKIGRLRIWEIPKEGAEYVRDHPQLGKNGKALGKPRTRPARFKKSKPTQE